MEIAYSSQYKSILSRKSRLLIFVFILLLHFIFLIYVISSRLIQCGVGTSVVSKLIYLPDQPQSSTVKVLTANHLELKTPRLVFSAPPDFQIESKSAQTPDYIDENLKPYLSNAAPSSGIKGDFSGVFDPRVRKKIAESNQLISKPKAEKYKTTYLSDGSMMVEIGDGQCILSMPKTNSNDRGTTWSTNTVKCGKSDSEKFMDNVQRDLNERRGKKQQ